MTKKLTILVIGVVLLGITAFSFNSQINPIVPVAAEKISPEVPDAVIYRQMFRHAAALKEKADELERQGKDAKHLRGIFKRKADLSDEQAQAFDEISSQCALEIKAIDERAKPIIKAYREQYPNGQIPHGQLPQAPPVELQQMTKERNDLVLRKRDELRAAFGENEFKRFQEFVKNKVAPGVNSVSAGR
jgi:hypothetical protein